MRALPVVISGAGPVGLTLSTLLSRLGVSNVVVEKAPRLSEHPSAHFISCRSMEIFRHAFSPELWSALQSCIPSLALWRHFSYAVHMTGREIGRVDHFAGLPASASIPSHALTPRPDRAPTPAQVLACRSPAHVAHLSQKRLVPHLLDVARKAGSTVLLDHEVEDVTESESGVTLSVRNHAHGSFETLSCHYLVAADGANSRIRKHLGIDVTGPAALQNLINVHFSSRELARMLTEQQAHAMLHFVYNKDVLCVLVTHDFESGEFVCQLPYFPPIQEFEDFTESQCVELVVSAVGHDISQDLKVHSIRPWTMQCQITDRYFSHPLGSRVILVGDAAHRFPPSGGLGMNTGVQDAHNLAWKLALVEHGRATNPTALLHTYEVERRPAAAVNATLSLKNFQRSLRVAEALGLDRNKVTDIVESAGPLMPKDLYRNAPFSLVVNRILQRAFEGVLSLGRRPLMCLETPGNAYGDQLMEKAREVLRDGAGLPLLFPLHDLGFHYEPSAPESLEPLVDSATVISPDISHTDTPTTAHATTSNGEQCAIEVLASVIVGSRVPHIPVLLEGSPISTTDLPDQLMTAASLSSSRDDALRCPFAVLLIQPKHRTGAVLKSVTWEGAQVSVVTVEVVPRGTEQSTENAQTIPVGAMSEGERCKVVEAMAVGFVRAVDAWGRWEKEVGVGKGVLIRPDGHVWMVLPENKLGKHWQEPEEE